MLVTERDIQHKKEEIAMLTQMLDNAKKDLKQLEKLVQENHRIDAPNKWLDNEVEV